MKYYRLWNKCTWMFVCDTYFIFYSAIVYYILYLCIHSCIYTSFTIYSILFCSECIKVWIIFEPHLVDIFRIILVEVTEHYNLWIICSNESNIIHPRCVWQNGRAEELNTTYLEHCRQFFDALFHLILSFSATWVWVTLWEDKSWTHIFIQLASIIL